MKDGGPAFPAEYFPEPTPNLKPFQGMSLRDWFAGMASIGLCANNESYKRRISEVAESAYLMADAMLKEREKLRSE